MPQAFRKSLWVSVIVHIAFLVLAVYSPELFHLMPHTKTKITWIRLTKGTGEDQSPYPFKKAKGMPYSTIREQKEALKEIAKDQKGTDVKSLESPIKRWEKQVPTEKRISDEGGINFKAPKGTRERTIEEALARVQEQLEKRQVDIEAAQIEKEGSGQSPYGTLDVTQGETNPALIAYYEAVKKKINEQWITTPKQLEEGEMLRTTINVLIDGEGNVVSSTYEAKSGDPSFDLSAMRAIERAAPFPVPPEEIRSEAITEGFLIEFNPRSVVGTGSN